MCIQVDVALLQVWELIARKLSEPSFTFESLRKELAEVPQCAKKLEGSLCVLQQHGALSVQQQKI